MDNNNEQIKIEKVSPKDGSFSSALDVLKNSQGIKEATDGYSVKIVEVNGGDLIRTVKLTLVKNNPTESEISRSLASFIKQAAESVARILEKMDKNEDSKEQEK